MHQGNKYYLESVDMKDLITIKPALIEYFLARLAALRKENKLTISEDEQPLLEE